MRCSFSDNSNSQLTRSFPRGMIPSDLAPILPTTPLLCTRNPLSTNPQFEGGIAQSSFRNIVVCAEVTQLSISRKFQPCCYDGVHFNLRPRENGWHWTQRAPPCRLDRPVDDRLDRKPINLNVSVDV